MCGIVGIISNRQVTPLLIDGLKRLEYRGYDSAGVATLVDGKIERRRAKGKIVNLEKKIAENPLPGTIGIGHTRWATHGVPNEANAHPHATKHVAVVHNGIIENYRELRDELKDDATAFYNDNVMLQRVIASLKQGFDGEKFDDIANYLLVNSPMADPYMCMADFSDFLAIHKKTDDLYADRIAWNKKSLMNIAGAGYFSADRAIKEYAENIWKLKQIR